MRLWTEWYGCVRQLRAACSRSRSFYRMVLVLAALSTRLELAGVTSFVRVLGLAPAAYRRLLHLFHSTAVDLGCLTQIWARLVLKLFTPLMAGNYMVCLADGVKAPKEGRKMPAVRSLHHSADSNSKPPFIMGHSFQAVSRWLGESQATWAPCRSSPGSTRGWSGPTATSAPCLTGWLRC